jgi:hypothetical protein
MSRDNLAWPEWCEEVYICFGTDLEDIRTKQDSLHADLPLLFELDGAPLHRLSAIF